MKTHYRTVIISDTHLCSRDCQTENLLSFLKSLKCDRLFIAGDFIDVWQLKRKWLWPPDYNDVIRKIFKMARKGTQVVFIPGNHDELFREFVGTDFGGVRIELNAMHQTADGRKMYITHGDEFDTVVKFNKWLAYLGSAAYDYLIYANSLINWFRRRLGWGYWSFAAAVKRRIKNAESYIASFEEAVVVEAKKKGADVVVCGHIHSPNIKEIDGVLYCNSGDWVDTCTAIVEHDDGKLEILRWKPLTDATPSV